VGITHRHGKKSWTNLQTGIIGIILSRVKVLGYLLPLTVEIKVLKIVLLLVRSKCRNRIGKLIKMAIMAMAQEVAMKYMEVGLDSTAVEMVLLVFVTRDGKNRRKTAEAWEGVRVWAEE